MLHCFAGLSGGELHGSTGPQRGCRSMWLAIVAGCRAANWSAPVPHCIFSDSHHSESSGTGSTLVPTCLGSQYRLDSADAIPTAQLPTHVSPVVTPLHPDTTQVYPAHASSSAADDHGTGRPAAAILLLYSVRLYEYLYRVSEGIYDLQCMRKPPKSTFGPPPPGV